MQRLRSRYLNVPLTAVLHPAFFLCTSEPQQSKKAALTLLLRSKTKS